MNEVNFENIFNILPDPIFVIDQNLNILSFNSRAREILEDFSPSEKCYKIIYNRENTCPYCPLKDFGKTKERNPRNFFHKQGNEIVTLYRKKDINLTISISFLPADEVDNFYFLEIIRNITRQKEIEDETLRIRNLASLGTMISGVAHELNNPLTGISLTIQNLKKEKAVLNDPKVLEKIESIEKDVSRADKIIKDITSFSKKPRLTKTRSELLETIHSAKYSVERAYPKLCENIEWEFSFEEKFEFYYDSSKIEQVFINLFTNSIQAIDYKKGKIKVEAKRKKRECKIIVEDNGGGIKSDVIDRIFDPFFTSKANHQGTGLGLSICHTIIQEHGGRIIPKSFDDKTRFIISLPIDE